MPETMSLERRTLLAMLGAKLVLTPAPRHEGRHRPRGTTREGDAQFVDSPAVRESLQPRDSQDHHGVEIWEDTDGKVDILVSAVGTAAPSPAAMRSSSPSARPSPPSRGTEGFAGHFANARRPAGEARPHKIQGTGAGFVPKNLHLKDEKGNAQITECVQ